MLYIVLFQKDDLVIHLFVGFTIATIYFGPSEEIPLLRDDFVDRISKKQVQDSIVSLFEMTRTSAY